MGKMKNAHKILVGKHREETTGRPRRRWKNNNKIDLEETVGGCELDASGSGWAGNGLL
jgi:hypothetical protein